MMNKRRKIAILALTSTAAIGVALYQCAVGVSAGGSEQTWGYRRLLPPTAEDIHEVYWEDKFLPDYEYRLRARVTEPEFQEYVTRLGCAPHAPTRTYYPITGTVSPSPGWSSRGGPSWWHPSESLDKTFVRQNGNEWIQVKYEDGYLYVNAVHP